MGKIIITLTGRRPQVKFRGEVTNEDIRESRRVLDYYLPKSQKPHKKDTSSIDIPLGDYDGKE